MFDGWRKLLSELRDVQKSGSTRLDLRERLLGWNGVEALPPVGVFGTREEADAAREDAIARHLENQRLKTEFFEVLGELDFLEVLDLSGNMLSDLPIEFDRFPALRELNLAANYLEKLPGGLQSMSSLRRLDLSKNKLRSILELPFDSPLESLDLSGNSISDISKEFSRLQNLRELKLNTNRLSSLSDYIGDLVRLERLEVHSNQIESVSALLGSLRNLKILKLNRNGIVSLPIEIGQLDSLEVLDVGHNQLLYLPDTIGGMVNLRRLELGGNSLRELPELPRGFSKLQWLDLLGNKMAELPSWLCWCEALEHLNVVNNHLVELPRRIDRLQRLTYLNALGNHLTELPETIRWLQQLKLLRVSRNRLTNLPDRIGELSNLRELEVDHNQLSRLPRSLANLNLNYLDIGDNPLSPEVFAAFQEGLETLKRFLQVSSEEKEIYEAKLILVGEGEVGKTSLVAALRCEEWVDDRSTTHGIQINPVSVPNSKSGADILLNAWDFGGQRVYRPTHQLFFSAPAVYLVVWKPREGPQQGLVREWIQLIKFREPAAKIIVVATHGGPKERQPDIDRQELWDHFGKSTIVDFVLVDSKPNSGVSGAGIEELRKLIGTVASELPEMGRRVPASWLGVRKRLRTQNVPFLTLEAFYLLCQEAGIESEEASDFLSISHRLGDLIHYAQDSELEDLVILKPDWLATAISFVLEDSQIRANRGLVERKRLSELWNDPERPADMRYPPELHSVFLKLMERFDLSYKVVYTHDSGQWSLIAQLVPDLRPDFSTVWPADPEPGESQQVQICRVVQESNSGLTNAEGLFFQLIVRLHRYSIGKNDVAESIHWQRGLILADSYNGKAFLEYLPGEVRITVRAPYAERFMSVLTEEVTWLVGTFWRGLRCVVLIPCGNQCSQPGQGLFDVKKLMEAKKRDRSDYPCSTCDTWLSIDSLLRNTVVPQSNQLDKLVASVEALSDKVGEVRTALLDTDASSMPPPFRALLSRMDAVSNEVFSSLVDVAKDGPRLFVLESVETGFWDKPSWISAKFRLILWCEHSTAPLHSLDDPDTKRGVYDIEIPRDWLVKSAPFLRFLTGAISIALPVAASAAKFEMGQQAFQDIEKQLDLSQKAYDAVSKTGGAAGSWMLNDTSGSVAPESNYEGQAILRQVHRWLLEKDPSFGGLLRVQNKYKRFLWVHPKFKDAY